MKKEKRDNYTFLTHAPVHHVIFTMAIPTIISMLSTSMYNLADTYFVGSINTQSVAAVGVSFAAMAVIQAIGFLFGHGAGNYVSRQLGAKHTEQAQKMAAPDYKVRFKDAASMLNYGFSKCSLYIDKKMEALPEIPVRNGKKKTVSLVYEEQFHYLDTTGQNIGNVKRKLRIHRVVKAPVKKNTLAGEMIYSVDGKELGRVRILYGENAGKATYPDCLKKVVMRL